MDAFKPYLHDLAQLAQAGAPSDAMLADPESFLEEMRPSLEVLEDGRLDPGDLEAISGAFWEKFKAEKIAALKKTYRLHRQLMPLYEYMESAPEEAWESLAKIMHDFEFEAQAPLFRLLAASRPDFAENATASLDASDLHA